MGPPHSRFERGYISLQIPESVMTRVHRRMLAAHELRSLAVLPEPFRRVPAFVGRFFGLAMINRWQKFKYAWMELVRRPSSGPRDPLALDEWFAAQKHTNARRIGRSLEQQMK